MHFAKYLRIQTLHHKLMLVLSLPMLLWMISGCYFVWLDLDYIRGDHYQAPYQAITLKPEHLSFSDITHRYPDATSLDLVMIAGEPFYRLNSKEKRLLVNANTNEVQDQITQTQAEQIAYSVMPTHIRQFETSLLTKSAPSELSPRHLPVWQISFDDRVNSKIYVSATSGKVVARRHDFWRIFDVFWRIHIMDYDDGANVNNWLLFIAALTALLATIAGIAWQAKWLKRGRI